MVSQASLGIQAFFDGVTGTVSYVLHDVASRAAAVIDPVWDFDAKSGHTSTASAQQIVDYVRAQQLDLRWVLETHAHADHLSAAQWLRAQAPQGTVQTAAPVVIGQRITTVQKVFGGIYGIEGSIAPQGADFDRLLSDGEVLALAPRASAPSACQATHRPIWPMWWNQATRRPPSLWATLCSCPM